MGVSGSGKSTVAEALAPRLGWVLGEADDFHPPENVARMEQGIALTSEDRWPWLHALAEWIGAHDAAGTSTVLACSALRRSYRDVLRSGVRSDPVAGAADGVGFVHLVGPTEVLASRMSGREGHFMPAELLRSQLETLEPLESDEVGVVLDIRSSPEELVEAVIAWLHTGDASTR
ncbi:MAG: gluconokinase [Actinomycetia bacterium]|nr:gluconokinase [Actinomycetes bacterium]